MDLNVIINDLQRRVAELLQQDNKNRKLLEELLKKHKYEKDDLENKINELKKQRPIIVTQESTDSDVDQMQILFDEQKKRHDEEKEKLEEEIDTLKQQRRDNQRELDDLLEQLNKLSDSQQEVETLLHNNL